MWNDTKINKSTAVKNQLPVIPVFLTHSALRVCPAKVLLPVGKMIIKMPTIQNLDYTHTHTHTYIYIYIYTSVDLALHSAASVINQIGTPMSFWHLKHYNVWLSLHFLSAWIQNALRFKMGQSKRSCKLAFKMNLWSEMSSLGATSFCQLTILSTCHFVNLSFGQLFLQNDKLTKWQVDKMTSWQNDKLTKRQVDKMTSWQNDKLMKRQFGKKTNWWKGNLEKRQKWEEIVK